MSPPKGFQNSRESRFFPRCLSWQDFLPTSLGRYEGRAMDLTKTYEEFDGGHPLLVKRLRQRLVGLWGKEQRPRHRQTRSMILLGLLLEICAGAK